MLARRRHPPANELHSPPTYHRARAR
jgi:hypothetical protein